MAFHHLPPHIRAPQEAEHAHKAGEKMSDLEVLVSEMEAALKVGDIGDDLASTKQLSKKHQVSSLPNPPNGGKD